MGTVKVRDFFFLIINDFLIELNKDEKKIVQFLSLSQHDDVIQKLFDQFFEDTQKKMIRTLSNVKDGKVETFF
ncbi:hypothetical protein [Holospora curviuscula]|uniref:Uncharacterized protein n=1 Tax=Holospora curviuscula TaxID=1082868 RepID=A0A2S5R7H4_9PROT|nr:hypothetical protein [Holospora curviuscula]PPE03291.1 hypothetical protein HCUR_01264 [Holospora curviuscula]